jgi:hypothetical protein
MGPLARTYSTGIHSAYGSLYSVLCSVLAEILYRVFVSDNSETFSCCVDDGSGKSVFW